MPGTVIGLSLNNGFVGQVSHSAGEIIRSHPAAPTAGDIFFGDPVAIDSSGQVTRLDADSTATDFAGVCARRVQTPKIYPDQTLMGVSSGEIVDVIQVGSVTVRCQAGSPAIGGAVYVRVDDAVSPSVVGGFEAAADGTDTIKLTKAM